MLATLLILQVSFWNPVLDSVNELPSLQGSYVSESLHIIPAIYFIPWHWRPAGALVSKRTHAPATSEIIDVARNYIGFPYVWGGIGGEGFDCSGFTNTVYALVGYDLPRNSREQFKVGLYVDRNNLQQGDLLFFVQEPGQKRISHVGIYIGDDEFIHAAMGKGEVTYDRISSHYYNARLFGARRFVVLPPGIYSTSYGAARSGLYFSSPQALGNFILEEPVDVSNPPDFDGFTDTLMEHSVIDKQPQIRRNLIKGAVTAVGPMLLVPQATILGLRVGIGGMGGEGFLVAAPEFQYFGHQSAFSIMLSAPFQIPLSSGSVSTQAALQDSWSGARNITKIIREVKYGQKESQLFLEVSRTSSASLGHGQLLRYLTPNFTSSFLPHYGLEADALTLSFDGYLDFGGMEVFVDDVFDPQIFGGLFFIRPASLFGFDHPLLKKLSLAATYVLDRKAPFLWTGERYLSDALHGIGFDIEAKLLKTESIDVKMYGDWSFLGSRSVFQSGIACGGLIRMNLGATKLHVIRARFEGRLSQPGFIPSYFDVSYAFDRYVMSSNQDHMTKLALLRTLQDDGAWRLGFFSELIYQYSHRFSFGINYEDNIKLHDDALDYTGNNAMLFIRINNLYLPKSSKAINIYASYHLRNFNKHQELLSLDRTNEFLFAGILIQTWRYLHLGASIKKTMGTDPRANRASLDGMLEAMWTFEL